MFGQIQSSQSGGHPHSDPSPTYGEYSLVDQALYECKLLTSFSKDHVFFPFLDVEELLPVTSETNKNMKVCRGCDCEVAGYPVNYLVLGLSPTHCTCDRQAMIVGMIKSKLKSALL